MSEHVSTHPETTGAASGGRRPRVLMLLHGFFPTEVRVAAEVRAAVAAGFEVDVIALRGEGDAPTGTAEGARYVRLPIDHVHGSGLGSVVKEYVGFTALATVKAARLALRHRYDIVQVHNPPDFLAVAAAVPRALGCAARLRRARSRLRHVPHALRREAGRPARRAGAARDGAA